MKTPMVSSATSFQRLQTSLQSPMPRLPRSNVYSTRDPANPSASVHRKRFFTPSLTLNISMRWLLESGGNIFHEYWRYRPFFLPYLYYAWLYVWRGEPPNFPIVFVRPLLTVFLKWHFEHRLRRLRLEI